MNLSLIKNPSGIVLLNKAPGLTSFKTLGSVKRYFQTKKVGHAGTLDQFASGLMLVGVGDGTRLMSSFVGLDKVYVAGISFGSETSTLDPEGEVISRGPVPSITDIQTVLGSFLGEIEQIPPRYSAIHIDGKRAYQRALSGEEFEIPARRVRIHSLEFLSWEEPICHIRVHVSSGTYIRSLARDLASTLGTVAHLVSLERTVVGRFNVLDAVNPEHMDQGLLRGRKLAEVLGKPVLLELDTRYLADFQNGKPLSESWFLNPGDEKNFEEVEGTELPVVLDDLFLGMIKYEKGRGLRYHHVFAQAGTP